jgi:hypothetical protein
MITVAKPQALVSFKKICGRGIYFLKETSACGQNI